MRRVAVDMKYHIHIHIHIHRFFVDIHGYIHIHGNPGDAPSKVAEKLESLAVYRSRAWRLV